MKNIEDTALFNYYLRAYRLRFPNVKVLKPKKTFSTFQKIYFRFKAASFF